jgi:hypothetical protein
MSKPSNGRRLLVTLLLLIPVLAVGAVSVGTPAPAPARPAATEPSPRAQALYQIRCWQHGRLLFEDRITLPGDGTGYGNRLSGTDRYGKPMYVAETSNSTCLIRHMAPASQ